MIKLTRLDGSAILLNEDYIENITHAPDTIITLQNGHVHVVKEPMDVIMELCIKFKQNCFKKIKEN